METVGGVIKGGQREASHVAAHVFMNLGPATAALSGGFATPSVPAGRQKQGSQKPQAIIDAEDEARQIIEDAIHTAEQEAESMMVSAMEEGMSEGRREGHEEGLKSGYAEGLLQGRAQFQAGLDLLAKLTAELDPPSPFDDPNLQDLLTFALAVAARIVQTEVLTNPQAVVAGVVDALSRARRAARATVRVNPGDGETVREVLDEVRLAAGYDELAMIEDAGIARGGCAIDTPTGSVDARIDTKLREITRELLDEGIPPSPGR